MVGRQLHDERRDRALEQGVLENQPGQDGEADPGQVEQEDHVLAADREEGGGEQRIDRQPSTAAHERVHHNGQGAIALVLEGAGRHDRRHVAAEPDQQRHERLARQAEHAHEAVHDEGGARHVAGALEKGQGEEHEADRRDEGRHGLDAAADAGGEQPDQPGRGVEAAEQFGHAVDEDGAGRDVEEVDKSAADVDGEHESQIHHQEEDRQAEHAVEDHLVDLVGQGLAELGGVGHDVGRQPIDEAVAGVGQGDIGIFAEVGGERLLVALQFFAQLAIDQGDVLGVVLEQLHGQPVGLQGVPRGNPRDPAGQGRGRFLDLDRVDDVGFRNRVVLGAAVHDPLQLGQAAALGRGDRYHRHAKPVG